MLPPVAHPRALALQCCYAFALRVVLEGGMAAQGNVGIRRGVEGGVGLRFERVHGGGFRYRSLGHRLLLRMASGLFDGA